MTTFVARFSSFASMCVHWTQAQETFFKTFETLSVCLGYAQKITYQHNVTSLADTMISWLSKEMLANPSFAFLIGPKGQATNQETSSVSREEQAMNQTSQIISRFILVYLFYHRVSSMAALVNGSIGIVHLGGGFIQRFKATKNKEEEKWNSIAFTIHKGFVHLLTAGYEFGIGFLLSRKYLGLIGGVAFSIAPSLVIRCHQKIFKKFEEMQDSQAANRNQEQQDKKVSRNEQTTTFPSPNVNPPLQSSDSSRKPCLDRTCVIYIIARSITSECMPGNSDSTESILKRILKAWKRIIGRGSEESALPNYGL